MKVMIQAPWDSEPHGPYEASRDEFDRRVRVVTKGTFAWVTPVEWCTEVREPKFPEGFPVKLRHTKAMYQWRNTKDPDAFVWPRAPWESAPEWATHWLVLADASTHWVNNKTKAGSRFGGVEIVHVEERK